MTRVPMMLFLICNEFLSVIGPTRAAVSMWVTLRAAGLDRGGL